MLRALVIRADANIRIGTGHLMRGLALAQVWRDAGGKVLFVLAGKASSLKARLRREGLEARFLQVQPGSAEDASRTSELARRWGCRTCWISVDGLHFGAGYQRTIKNHGLRLLVVDDCGHAKRYCADIVLNQNLHASERLYKNKEPRTRLLLGTRYVLLRREFLKQRNNPRKFPAVARKVLVTLGGGDAGNQTLKVLQALGGIPLRGLRIAVVVGAINRHLPLLEREVKKGQVPMRLIKNPRNMAQWMAWADLAISSGGTTVWELAFTGLPAIVLPTAPIESLLASGLKKHGLFFPLGLRSPWSKETLRKTATLCLRDRKRRVAMSHRGREMVDGFGGSRLLRAMNEKPPPG